MGNWRSENWKRENNPNQSTGKYFTCPICKKEFWGKGSEKRNCCSNICRGKYRSLNYVGANHPSSWKGGITSGGYEGKYVHVYMPNHPRAHHGHVAEHILVAEKALGKALPPQAVIHHINRNEKDNTNCNLVICEGQGYHRTLHARERRINNERNRASAT